DVPDAFGALVVLATDVFCVRAVPAEPAEVAVAADLPVLIGHRREEVVLVGEVGAAAAVPDHVFARGLVAPHDVDAAAVVEVAGDRAGRDAAARCQDLGGRDQ